MPVKTRYPLPAAVERNGGNRFVHRDDCMGKPLDALPVTHHLLHRIAKHDPDILDRVVAVHMQVTFCGTGEIKSPVLCHRR